MPSSLYLPKIVRKRSKLHGWGVFAAEPINKNKIIVDYAGELITNKESNAREHAYLNQGCIWVFKVNTPLVARCPCRRQRRPVHQPLVHAQLLQRRGRQDDLDPRRQAHRAGRRADLRLQHRGRQDHPMSLQARLQDLALSRRRRRAARLVLAAATCVAVVGVTAQAPAPLPREAAALVVDWPSGRTVVEARADVLDTPVLPGSVAKVFALAAAAEAGVLPAGSGHMCRRVATADGRRFVCSHPDLKRPLSPAEALAYSCNDFFVAARRPVAAGGAERRAAPGRTRPGGRRHAVGLGGARPGRPAHLATRPAAGGQPPHRGRSGHRGGAGADDPGVGPRGHAGRGRLRLRQHARAAPPRRARQDRHVADARRSIAGTGGGLRARRCADAGHGRRRARRRRDRRRRARRPAAGRGGPRRRRRDVARRQPAASPPAAPTRRPAIHPRR